jgi:GNAT superfamily N-acetyltransferase
MTGIPVTAGTVGEPVTLQYARRTDTHAADRPTTGYGQEVEPRGRYLTVRDPDSYYEPDRHEFGEVTFRRPLHLDFGGGYDEPSNWKRRLSAQYGGLVGRALSDALVADGHDGVVTHDRYGTSEVVDLTGLRPKSQEREQARSRKEQKAELRARIRQEAAGSTRAPLRSPGGQWEMERPLPPGVEWTTDAYGDEVLRNTERRHRYGPVMSEAQAKAQGWVGPFYHGTTKANARNIRQRGFRQERMEPWQLQDVGTIEEVVAGNTHNTWFGHDYDLARSYAGDDGDVVAAYLHPEAITHDHTMFTGAPVVRVADVHHAAVVPDHVPGRRDESTLRNLDTTGAVRDGGVVRTGAWIKSVEHRVQPVHELRDYEAADMGVPLSRARQAWEASIPHRDADFHASPGEEMRRHRALVDDVRRNGIQQPLTFEVRNGQPPFLRDGHHRWIAAEELGLKSVPVRYEYTGTGQRHQAAAPPRFGDPDAPYVVRHHWPQRGGRGWVSVHVRDDQMRHPDEDPEVGRLSYHAKPLREGGKYVKFRDMIKVDPEHQRRGLASAMMDRLRQDYPGSTIDPVEFTADGQQWWDAYRGQQQRTAAAVPGWFGGRPELGIRQHDDFADSPIYWSDARWHGARPTRRTIDPGQLLHTTQEEWADDARPGSHYVEHPQDYSAYADDELPRVARIDGQLWVGHGHHRLMADRQLGRPTTVSLVDHDANRERQRDL